MARRKHPPSAHPSRLLHEGGTPSPLDRRWYSRVLPPSPGVTAEEALKLLSLVIGQWAASREGPEDAVA